MTIVFIPTALPYYMPIGSILSILYIFHALKSTFNCSSIKAIIGGIVVFILGFVLFMVTFLIIIIGTGLILVKMGIDPKDLI